ncbi:MAG: hypothetical protein E7179_04315 [Erysipelotrichaceae bacterium]|nr:hypothetical protein [Erysipelotrichaceae bacterium]
MAYKLGLLLSIAFMMAVILLVGDMALLSGVRGELDALSLTVSYRIAYEGRLSEGTKGLVSSYGAEIELETKGALRIGDVATFSVYKTYTPFVLGKGPMTITVRRSTVVGYYD